MIPDKIYTFQDDGDRYWYKPEEWETPPLTRVEYIRKDTLLAWAKAVKADPMIPMNIDKVIEKIQSL